MRPPSLPPDAELSKLLARGHSNRSIAREYGVTPQAVDLRLKRMGVYRMPGVKQANDLIRQAWTVNSARDENPHHGTYAAQCLRAYVRSRLGDETLTERARENVRRFQERLVRDGVVLDYDPLTVTGFSYVKRLPEDGRLVIRWPANRPRPSAEALEALSLPEAPEEGDGQSR
jgi:hypothetical protein